MLRLGYGSLTIEVASADPAPLLWLEEFLGGAFDPASPGAPPHHIVRLEFGSQAPVDPRVEIECFSLDSEFLRLPGARLADGTLRLTEPKEGILLELRRRETAIVAPSDGPGLRLCLLRVVRELATAHALREGQLHLHAAAVALPEGVVALSGPRGSGKSTLLLHALLSGGFGYVTNDRLFADLRLDPPRCRAMPTIVSLRDETLARFPAFAERLKASAFGRQRTIAEAARATGWRPHLTPAQLRALAGSANVGQGPLRAAVFPTLAPDAPLFELRTLRGQEAADRVRRGLFLAAVPERAAAAFAGDDPPARDEAALQALCRDFAARVPCLDLRLGPRAYESTGLWTAIRERLA